MYCKQTGKLIARVAESLPNMSSELMQQWIDNPLGLQRVLKRVLNPSKIIRPANFRVWKTSLAVGNFVAVKPAQLGFANGNVTHGEIYDRAIEVGLDLYWKDQELRIDQAEIGDGLILMFESSSPTDGRCPYIKYLRGPNNPTISGSMNLNEICEAKMRYIFVKKPSKEE